MAECSGSAWVVTKYPDGTEVHAHPQHDEDAEAYARSLGYPNVDYQTLIHDPMHHIISHILHREPSHVITGLADPEVAAAQEAVVAAVERYLNILKGNKPT